MELFLKDPAKNTYQFKDLLYHFAPLVDFNVDGLNEIDDFIMKIQTDKMNGDNVTNYYLSKIEYNKEKTKIIKLTFRKK